MGGEKSGGGGGGGGAEYGTFKGRPPSYPPPRPPVVGYPQPAPPPGLYGQPAQRGGGYQEVDARDYEASVHGHNHDRLPCCGIGLGWFLFIVGFFLGGIPWYLGAFVLWCARVDYREKPGYVACTIAAVLATIAIVIGVTASA